MKNAEIKADIKIYSFDELDVQRKSLVEASRKATESAYAPYSNFHVGAAVLLENGEIFSGNNQENAAYTNGLCAERTALFYANSKYPDVAVKMIAISAYTNGDFTKDVCSPCGSCRQVLIEVENRFEESVVVLMTGKDLVYEVDSAKALLPLSFGKENLG